jgi:hypothetical protein
MMPENVCLNQMEMPITAENTLNLLEIAKGIQLSISNSWRPQLKNRKSPKVSILLSTEDTMIDSCKEMHSLTLMKTFST